MDESTAGPSLHERHPPEPPLEALAAPDDFPTGGPSFWEAADAGVLAPPPPAPAASVLERLGPSPFPKSRFPFLGFLATVYDHVAAQMNHVLSDDRADEPGR